MLVYNLPRTEAIFDRFGGIAGSAYFVGGLGMTAPNPLLSTLRYFRDEYLALLRKEAEPTTAPSAPTPG